MTTVVLRRTGNSLGFTLPSAEVKRLGLHPGDRVNITIQKAPGIESIFGLMKGKFGDVDKLMREIDEGAD